MDSLKKDKLCFDLEVVCLKCTHDMQLVGGENDVAVFECKKCGNKTGIDVEFVDDEVVISEKQLEERDERSDE